MKKCTFCGTESHDSAVFCELCGQRFEPEINVEVDELHIVNKNAHWNDNTTTIENSRKTITQMAEINEHPAETQNPDKDNYESSNQTKQQDIFPEYKRQLQNNRLFIILFAIAAVGAIIFTVSSRESKYNGSRYDGTNTENNPVASESDNSIIASTQQEYLSNMHIFKTHSDVLDNIIESGTIQDAYGNTYDAPYFDLCSYGGVRPTQAFTELVTGGKYMYLKGTYFCRPNQDDDFEITFQIYADGVLVYDSGVLTRDDHPENFEICINNAEIVRVTSMSDDDSIYNTNPGVIVADAIVYN